MIPNSAMYNFALWDMHFLLAISALELNSWNVKQQEKQK